MFASFRRWSAISGALVVASAFVIFAAADDPTTDIVIVAPDIVMAPTAIQGYVTEYTPAVYISAHGQDGSLLSIVQANPNSSNKCGFCIPTDVDRAPEIVTITACDSAGQTGTAFVAVVKPQ